MTICYLANHDTDKKHAIGGKRTRTLFELPFGASYLDALFGVVSNTRLAVCLKFGPYYQAPMVANPDMM
jgi:hypothetical protein